MNSGMSHARSGASMIEVIVALTLASVLGATATGAFVTQSRFFDVQEKVGFARGVSRSAMNVIVTELRMVEQTSGVVSATSRQLTVRAPFALGVVCGTATQLTISQLPADEAMLDDAEFGGIAFRDQATGSYVYHDDRALKPTPKKTATPVCAAAGISVYSDDNADGRVLQGPLPDSVPDIGAPIFLYQTITYEFRGSVSVPGRMALWRRTATGADEEIVAPFDTTAGFRFYVNDAEEAQDTAPAALHTITGIELTLDGISERPEDDGTHRTVPLRTSVFFKNRRS